MDKSQSNQPPSLSQLGGPRKAYLVTFKVVNQMEAVVYADSVADARRRFDAGDVTIENTYQDYRLPGAKVRRYRNEDR